jgi:uncharacterized protein (TIGR03083 family)
METDPRPIITALRQSADDLALLAAAMTADDLRRPSAATEWDVSQVLSHLGSGAEIALANLEANVAGTPIPGNDAARSVWDRYDAMSPEERRDAFLVADGRYVTAVEALDPSAGPITLPFLPAPVDLATALSFRLNEHALHAWDVRAATDDGATVPAAHAGLLVSRLGGLVGFIGKADRWTGAPITIAVRTSDPERHLWLTVGDGKVVLDDHERPCTATLDLPAEALLRLVTGRLAPSRTPSQVTLTGAITLDQLRAVFPGF